MKNVLSILDKEILSKKSYFSENFLNSLKEDFEASFVHNRPHEDKQYFERFVWIISKNILSLQNFILSEIYSHFNINDDNLFYYESWIYKSDKKTVIDGYHTHDFGGNINKVFPKPTHTFVFYVSMPNNDEGKLWFKLNEETNYYQPSVGELLIFPTDLPHMPEMNPNSDIPRLVYAGNFCKINKNYKKETKTLI